MDEEISIDTLFDIAKKIKEHSCTITLYAILGWYIIKCVDIDDAREFLDELESVMDSEVTLVQITPSLISSFNDFAKIVRSNELKFEKNDPSKETLKKLMSCTTLFNDVYAYKK